MGSTLSRVNRDNEAPAALRPVQRKIEEIKRRNRGRMGSISAVELLNPAGLEEDESPLEDEPALAMADPATPAQVMKVAAEKPHEADEEKGRKLGSSPADEETPGSPSFRYYCVAVVPVQDTNRGGDGSGGDHSFRAAQQVNQNDLKLKDNPAPHQREGSNESLMSTEDESEAKPSEKKDKGRRFRNLLNVQICSCSSSSTESPNADNRPVLITQKSDIAMPTRFRS